MTRKEGCAEATVQGPPSSAALRSYHLAALASKVALGRLPQGKRGRFRQGLGGCAEGPPDWHGALLSFPPCELGPGAQTDCLPTRGQEGNRSTSKFSIRS